MTFTVSSGVLSAKLSAIAKVINPKHQLLMLKQTAFEVIGPTLRLTGSDGENTLVTNIPLVASDGDQTFGLEATLLLDAVKGLAEEPVTFDVVNGIATISYHNGYFTLPVDEIAGEYPWPADLDGDIREKGIKSSVLAENIGRSLFAAATEELRPIMRGVFFDFETDNLSIVASDGRKLVSSQINSIKSEEPVSFVLPMKPSSILSSLLPNDDSNAVIKFNDKKVRITFTDTVLTSCLIDGHYPNYRSVFPKDNINKAVVSRRDLLAADKRILPFASQSSKLVCLHFEPRFVRLDAKDTDFSRAATETVEATYDGQAMDIGFNGQALADVLTNLESDEVEISLSDPSRAGIVMPCENPEDTEILMLLMPMLISRI